MQGANCKQLANDTARLLCRLVQAGLCISTARSEELAEEEVVTKSLYCYLGVEWACAGLSGVLRAQSQEEAWKSVSVISGFA